jgi:hypothetical protein
MQKEEAAIGFEGELSRTIGLIISPMAVMMVEGKRLKRVVIDYVTNGWYNPLLTPCWEYTLLQRTGPTRTGTEIYLTACEISILLPRHKFV